jgi:capsular exopolysaccharide synthesis family protein
VEPIQIVKALRLWWRVIALCLLVGALAAALFVKGSQTSYGASQVLILNASQSDSSVDPSQEVQRLAFLAVNGTLPESVAKQIGENPSVIAGGLDAIPDPTLGTITLTATAPTSSESVRTVEAFGEQLIAFSNDELVRNQDAKIAEAQGQVDQLQKRVDETTDPGSLDDYRRQLTSAQDNLAALQAANPKSGLEIVGGPHSSLVGEQSALRVRGLIGALVGLLLGAGLALVLARFDTRIRTKEDAEEAFGMPVLAEVPLLKRQARRKKRPIVTLTDQDSLGAEAYRRLRTLLLLAPRAQGSSDTSSLFTVPAIGARPGAAGSSRVIAVLSAGIAEGKTTTAANVAVALAHSGRSVLMVDLDLRRPQLAEVFDAKSKPGVTDVLRGRIGSLRETVQPVSPSLELVASGSVVEHPGELLAHDVTLLPEARKLADCVVVDTAPMLAADDTNLILPFCDEVIVVCRAGRTTLEAARRSMELLNRMSVHVAGVVLVGVRLDGSIRRYYRTDYRAARSEDVDTLVTETYTNGSTSEEPVSTGSGGSTTPEA